MVDQKKQSENFVSHFTPQILENNGVYTRFFLGLFTGGQALIIANALRRTLLAEMPAFMVTSVKIQGVHHEFATLSGLEENILTILLNIRSLVLTTTDFKVFSTELAKCKAYINFSGPGIIKAENINFPPRIYPVNPDHYIATVSSTGEFKSTLFIQKLNPLENGPQNKSFLGKASDELILDTTPKPVTQVNFGIHKVANSFNQESISLEIWTDGSITPKQALTEALNKLTEIFSEFSILNLKGLKPIDL